MENSLMEMQLNPPAQPDAVNNISAVLGTKPPDDYTAFLHRHDGGEGYVGDTYVMLWKAEELGKFNREYETEKYASGIVLFGSNGSGEAYGFDLKDVSVPVVSVPFVGMDRKLVVQVASSFSDFLTRSMGNTDAHKTRDQAGHLQSQGLEIFEIQPIILGGDPTDPQNKVWLTREKHIEIVRYWNGIVSDMRKVEGETK